MTTLTLLSANSGSVKAVESGQQSALNPVSVTPPPNHVTFQLSVSGPTPVFAQANIVGTADGIDYAPVATLLVPSTSASPAVATQDMFLGNLGFTGFSASVRGLSFGATATVTMTYYVTMS